MALVKRSDKVAFLGGLAGKANRMKGFTDLSTSKNPTEYTRQYVDEEFETTDVVAINTSMDFAFDQMTGNVVHQTLVDIIDGDKLGDDAVVNIIVVDFTEEGTEPNSFKAVSRVFAVIPSTEGDSLEAYTYSGTFRAKGPKVLGEVTSTDGFSDECTFTVGTLVPGGLSAKVDDEK